MAESQSIKRELVLILAGALISTSTAFMMNLFNDARAEREYTVQRKLALSQDIAHGLGRKLFLTLDLYNKRCVGDTSLPETLVEFHSDNEDWNMRFTSHLSLLKYYYNDSIAKRFMRDIHLPLNRIGHRAQHEPITSAFSLTRAVAPDHPDEKHDTTSFESMYRMLRRQNVEFVSGIYALADE